MKRITLADRERDRAEKDAAAQAGTGGGLMGAIIKRRRGVEGSDNDASGIDADADPDWL